LRPSELGAKSMFSGMFSSFSNKGESAEFSGEPSRQDLTTPPPGYQTPSPDQPYGIVPRDVRKKAMTPEERAAGTER
jgi:hypothetical protein